MEEIPADDGAYGYAAEASTDYFPNIIGCVEAVSRTESAYRTEIISDAQEAGLYARSELETGNYTCDAENDKYIFDNGEELCSRFYAVYQKFSEWLADYGL